MVKVSAFAWVPPLREDWCETFTPLGARRAGIAYEERLVGRKTKRQRRPFWPSRPTAYWRSLCEVTSSCGRLGSLEPSGIRITELQLAREGSPLPGRQLRVRIRAAFLTRARPSQTELSRKSNQVAGRRIRGFESDMPSHAVGLTGASQVAACMLAARA
jgi:hypothetical protein